MEVLLYFLLYAITNSSVIVLADWLGIKSALMVWKWKHDRNREKNDY
jgi:hypothetical protein